MNAQCAHHQPRKLCCNASFVGLVISLYLTLLRSVLLMPFFNKLKVHRNNIHDCLGMLQSLQEEVSQLRRGNASLIDTVAGLKVQVN